MEYVKEAINTAGNTFERLEKKILFPCELAPKLRERIGEYMEYDEYNSDGTPYMICNLYFDDDWNDVIRTSVERPMFKEKLRLRSYGVPDADTKVFLEMKKKFNGVGTKRRAKLTMTQIHQYLDTGKHPEGLKFIDEQVLNEIDYYRSHHPVEPKAYVSYLRIAYFAKDNPDFRVTFDTDIITRRYDLSLEAGRYGEPILPPGKLLLEVKFAGAVPVWFSHIMSEFGLSFNPFTKYGTDYRNNAKKIALESGAFDFD